MRRRTAGLTIFVAAQVAALALLASPAPATPGLDVHPVERHEITVAPGTAVGAAMVRVVATEPVTIVGARPLRLDPGMTHVSSQGRLKRGALPSWATSWELRGGVLFACQKRLVHAYGEPHGLGDLRLAAGETLWLLLSVRAEQAGTARGYVVTYRTDDGVIRTVNGDRAELRVSMGSGDPATSPDGLCPLGGEYYPEPAGGFPR